MSESPKPHVLFHYPILNTGGAENSVLRLTKFLVENGWKVDLVLTMGGGALESRIDPRVTVIRLRDRENGAKFKREKSLSKKMGLVFSDLIPYFVGRLHQGLRTRQFKSRTYDAAIISLQGLSPEFCCTKVNAKRRIQWIRNDLALCDPEDKAGKNIRDWGDRVDVYACVSESSRISLVNLFPKVADRAVTVYNIIDPDAMRQRAKEFGNPYEKFGDGLKVVTVCRLSDKAKALFRMLSVHKRLLNDGFRFKWFVVGDGPDSDALAKAVSDANLNESFIMMGHQPNPFPYYKYADFSATLSNYEGLCGSVNEAKIMGKPVIATHFSGIGEQITAGENGLIVENDEESIYVGMKRMLSDPEFRNSITNDQLPPAISDDQYKLKLLEQLVLGSVGKSA